MTPETLESAIIAKIETTGLIAVPYPSNPGNYYPENDPGEVLVRYEGRKVSDRDVSGRLSTVKYFIEIVVVSRELRGENGVYSWLEQINDMLEGYTLEIAAAPLFMEVESFVTEDDGLWQFGQKWSITQQQACTLIDEYDSPIGDN